MDLSRQLGRALHETPKDPTRDRGSGQYAHSKMDQLCVCGHSLGKHAAACVKGERPCFAGDDAGAESCDCNKFKKAKAK